MVKSSAGRNCCADDQVWRVFEKFDGSAAGEDEHEWREQVRNLLHGVSNNAIHG
jgi:hypothetical protein